MSLKEHNNQSVSGTSPTGREGVSALIDGEANDLDLARVLKGGEESDELRHYWQRQQQYSEVMRSGAGAASVTIAVVFGGQQALLFSDEPLPIITAPGAVVQLPGTGAVQASFAQPTLPLSQNLRAAQVDKSVDVRAEAATTRAFYNELAEKRSSSLGSVHQATAADVSISPFIARLAEPRVDQ